MGKLSQKCEIMEPKLLYFVKSIEGFSAVCRFLPNFAFDKVKLKRTRMASIQIKVYRNNNASNRKAYGRYFGRVAHSTTLDAEALCNRVAQDSHIEEGYVGVVFGALCKQMKELLCNGHPIEVEGLGIMKVGIKSKGVSAKDVKKRVPDFNPKKDDITRYLSARQVERPHLLFTPNKRIKELLREVKFDTDRSDWKEETE